MSHRPALLALCLSLLACDPGVADDDDRPRGPLGKADIAGTCQAADVDATFCGGRSADACWCDDLCESYGDCCEDKVAVCDEEPPAAVEREVEVIFTAPFCDECSSRDKSALLARSPIIKRVVELIDGAQDTVDVAQFTFSRREIESALVRAYERGISVRIAMDSKQDNGRSLSSRLSEAGLNVRYVQGDDNGGYAGIQHAKFMIVDGGTLLTGSNNWSSTGTSINAENTIVVTADANEPQIAGFACHFEAIWDQAPDDAKLCSTEGVAFTPGSDARNMLRDDIRASQSSVDVLMHHLTYRDLVKELAKAQERGVRVRVILNEADRAEHTGTNWTRLSAAGGEIRYKQNNEAAYQLMHHKLVVIDDATVINGSGNWSASAFYRNFENFVRYQEPAVASAFVAEFARLWMWSLTAASVDGGVSAAEQHADGTNVYFGNLHAHFYASEGGKLLDDGKGLVEDEDGDQLVVGAGMTISESAALAYEYARDVAELDFIALTPHCSDDRSTDAANMPNMSPEGFQTVLGMATEVSEASSGTFVAMAGMEWSTNSTGNHVNVIGASELSKVERGRFDLFYEGYLAERAAAGDRPMVALNHPRTMRLHEETLNGSWDQVYGVNLADVPKSGERKKKFNDYGLDDYAPLSEVLPSWIAGDAMPDAAVVNSTLANIATVTAPYMRLMEVTLGRGNEFSTELPRNPSMSSTEEGGLERRTKVHTDWDYYLLRGFRVAPIASHDNHWSNWGTAHTSRTAVVARELSNSSLLDAIDARQVFASEDENLDLRLYAGDRIPMGSSMTTTSSSVPVSLSLSDPDYHGGYEVRVFAGRVGGSLVSRVNTQQVPGDGWVNFTVAVSTGESFFYVEVVELDADRLAWSAPIWVERL